MRSSSEELSESLSSLNNDSIDSSSCSSRCCSVDVDGQMGFGMGDGEEVE